jgi:hypothetical protein
VYSDPAQSIYLADFCGWPHRPDANAERRSLLLAESGPRPLWRQGHHGRYALVRRSRPVRSPPYPAGDIVGSGTTDIIYLHREGARIYFNQSGNRWMTAFHLTGFPRIDNLSSVSTVDLLGEWNGVPGLVFATARRRASTAAIHRLDGGPKLHLLVRSANNLGAETRVEYAPRHD